MKIKSNITVLLTTCDRYETTLPLCLLSILNQTRKPDKIVIIDDSIKNKFYENYQIKQLLILAKYKNITIDYYFGEKKGMIPALEHGFKKIKDGWVFKIDDDSLLEPNVIEIFESNICKEIGAMSGIVVTDQNAYNRDDKTSNVSSKIKDIYTHFNIQMVYNQDDSPKEVEHLYSNYFFRKESLDSFPIELQPSGHREDTVVTHSIYRKKYKLFVYPDAKMYHLRTDNGNKKWGIKNESKNERIFIQKLKDWNVIPDQMPVVEDKDKICTVFNGSNYLILDKKYE